MVKMGREVVKKGLSVREVERAVRASKKSGAKNNDAVDPFSAFAGGKPAVQRATEELVRSLGTRVRIVPDGKKGKIEVDFASPEELARLIQHLRG